jgi:hypothetical protein
MKSKTNNKKLIILFIFFYNGFLFSQISIIDTVHYYEDLIKTSQLEYWENDSITVYKISAQEKIEIKKYNETSSLNFLKYTNSLTNSQIIKKTSEELRKYYLIVNNEIIQELILLNSSDTLSYKCKMNDTSYFFYYDSGAQITKKSVDKNLQDNGFYEIFIKEDSCKWKGNYFQINESKISHLDCLLLEQKKNGSSSVYFFLKDNEKIYTLRIGKWLKYNYQGEIIERKNYDYSNCIKK